MSAISIKEIAGVVKDAELTFTSQGKAVAKVYLAFSDSRKNEHTQEWESLNQFFVEGTAWENTAEQLTEAATKGAQLLVWGKLKTDQWQDKQTGDKRSKPALTIQGFRPVGKLPQAGQQSRPTQTAQQPSQWGGGQSDPWAGQPSGNTGQFGGSWDTTQNNQPAF